MSNSIWKMTNIKPEEDKDIVFMYGSLPTMGCYKNNDDTYIEHATGEIFYGNEVERWAYLADIIAQAEKAERLQKAVNTALISLGTAAVLTRKCVKKYTDAKIDLIKQLTKE